MVTQFSRTRNSERERESIRLQEWKKLYDSLGRLPTDAELATAIEAEQERRKPKPIQRGLFDSGSNAAESRTAAAIKSARYKTLRRVAVLEALELAGPRGLTRWEIASRLDVQQSSICSVVLELLASNQIEELRERRSSAVGGAGCVLVLKRFSNEGRKGA